MMSKGYAKVMRTPCDTCPKWKLCPNPVTPGLMPGNRLAVSLYYKASREHRVGTMDGAYLMYTLTPESARAVLDECDLEFRDSLDRRNTFEKLLILDQVRTKVVSDYENIVRERARNAPPKK